MWGPFWWSPWTMTAWPEVIEAAGGRCRDDARLTTRRAPTVMFEALADRIDPDGAFDLVVNLQGDLPTIEPDVVRAALTAPSRSRRGGLATLAAVDRARRRTAPIPNVVKVVGDPAGGAGQASAPSTSPARPCRDRARPGAAPHRSLRLSPGCPAAVRCASTVRGSRLRERLEQLRALEAGMRIDVQCWWTTVPFGVDTPEGDLTRARSILLR